MNPSIEIVPVLEDNYCFVLGDAQTGRAAIVDPPVVDPVLEVARRRGWEIETIVATHHHPDHVAGIDGLKEACSAATVYGPAAEAGAIPGLDRSLEEGDRLELAGVVYSVLETPGHTAGHISLYSEDAAVLFCADTLFVLGCGRVFEGTAEQMWASLEKLRALPDETRVYCGHEYTLSNARFARSIDPENRALEERARAMEELRAADRPTIPARLGDEKATNPFLRCDDPDFARSLALEGRSAAEVFGEIRRRKDRS